MKLIVGLGNPGKQYENTRHNMGFIVLDSLADSLGLTIDKNDFKGLYLRTKYLGEDIILFKPQTYMNLSGEAVVQIVNFFKIDLEDIIVIFDDLALTPGNIRLRLNGSSGGQKGIENIIKLLGTEQIKRIRIGIGQAQFDTVDHVLSKPTLEEKKQLDVAILNAVNAIKDSIKKDFHYAMSIYNKKEA